MIELLAAAVGVVWALVSTPRATRVGALAMSAVLVVAGLASLGDLGVWLEGGWGMHLLAFLGSYAVGAAVAHRSSSSRGSLAAALVGAVLLAATGAGLYFDGAGALDELVRHAPPLDAELIRDAGRAELARLLQLSGGLIGVIAAVLISTPRRRRGALGGGDETTTTKRSATGAQLRELRVDAAQL
jgi:hypothetical protein